MQQKKDICKTHGGNALGIVVKKISVLRLARCATDMLNRGSLLADIAAWRTLW